jgi:hypothetical protein
VPVKLASDGTPVREALRRVSGEGLVEFHPNRDGRAGDAELLMEAHLRAAMRQWEPERRRAAEAGAADGAGAARAS